MKPFPKPCVARCVPRCDGGYLIVLTQGPPAVSLRPLEVGARVRVENGQAVAL